MISGKRIFITGGAGFIGSTLAGMLADKNELILYDNMSRDALSSQVFKGHKNITLIKGDILDFEKLCRKVPGSNIVIHAAAIAGIETVLKAPVETMRINMIGTANLLEAVQKNCTSVERVVTFSTSEVFGQRAFKSEETDNTISGSVGEARWVYAVSKLSGEHLTIAYHQQHNLPTVSVRPFNVYGPGQVGEGAIQVFIRKALMNEDLFIFGDGNQIRAWCYIDDMIDGLMQSITRKEAVGESFNIGNARAVTTVLGLAQTICRVLNSKSKIVFKPDLSVDVELRIPGTKKAKELIDFEAKIDLEEGILRTAEWYRQHMNELPPLSALFRAK